METFTVGQMAERLAKAKPSLSASYFARQIRGWAQSDLFPDAGIRGSGRTAAQVFQQHHLVSAQIFGFLTTLGMTAPQLKKVSYCLHNGDGLRKAVKAYFEGDRDWRFILYLTEECEIYGGIFTKDKAPKEGVFQASAPNVLMLTARSIFRALDVAFEKDLPATEVDDGE